MATLHVFTATVNGLRGIAYFAEAHADDAGKAKGGVALAYEWRLHADGSATDRFSVYRNTADKDPTPFEDCPCGDEVLRCPFIWAPHFGEQLNQMHFVTEWDTDLIVFEPGNSYEPKTVVSLEILVQAVSHSEVFAHSSPASIFSEHFP